MNYTLYLNSIGCTIQDLIVSVFTNLRIFRIGSVQTDFPYVVGTINYPNSKATFNF